MFEFINGHVHSIGRGYVVLNANQIGYKLMVSAHCIGTCQQFLDSKKTVTLLCHLAVSDSAHTLYGFESETERALFRRLIMVNGIGPSTAVNLLSSLPPEALMNAIFDGNVATLMKMKGVGKKTAERLIVELRDHLDDLLTVNTSPNLENPHHDDLVRVLNDLGFSKQQANSSAQQAIEKLGSDCEFQDLLRCALQS